MTTTLEAAINEWLSLGAREAQHLDIARMGIHGCVIPVGLLTRVFDMNELIGITKQLLVCGGNVHAVVWDLHAVADAYLRDAKTVGMSESCTGRRLIGCLQQIMKEECGKQHSFLVSQQQDGDRTNAPPPPAGRYVGAGEVRKDVWDLSTADLCVHFGGRVQGERLPGVREVFRREDSGGCEARLDVQARGQHYQPVCLPSIGEGEAAHGGTA